MRREGLFISCVAALGMSAFGHGQALIDVAFGTGGETPVGAAYYGAVDDQWNEIVSPGGSTGALSVFDTAGNSTGITVNLNAEGAVLSRNTNTQLLPALTNYYAFNNVEGNIEADLAGLSADTVYNLALYVASDDGGGGDRSLTGMVNGAISTPFTATGIPQSSFINDQNLVLLSVETDANGDLSIIETNPGNGSGEIDFNGFQIQQATPEPVSLTIFGFGIGALIRRRRKQ